MKQSANLLKPTQNVIKQKYAYYQRIMKQLLHFEPTAHD